MEADYNFIYKLILVIKLMRKVKTKKRFPDRLRGSQKLYEVIDIVLNGKNVGDITRQLRGPGTIMEVDATSCYDRIVIVASKHEWMKLISSLS